MPLLPITHQPADQARELRALVAQRAAREATRPSAPPTCRSLAVVSGKGGVGKSVIALNLAVSLARRGDSVCLIDASPSLGHLELLCGCNGYWNLTHVATGSRRLAEVILDGPHGVHLVSGASCLGSEFDTSADLFHDLCELERTHDWLIFDTAAGEPRLTNRLARVSDRVLIVATPETTAIAEAYAALKGLSASYGPVASVIVNRADSEQQARPILERLRHAAKSLLHTDLDRAGFIPDDSAVAKSVLMRQPLADVAPMCSAQQAIDGLAERLARTVATQTESSCFARLMRQSVAAAATSVRIVSDMHSVRGNLTEFSRTPELSANSVRL